MSETIQKTEEKTEEKKQMTAHEIERYDIKTESKILKALSNIFEEQKNLVSEEEIINEEDINVVDLAHVCMISAKTTRAKIILRRFFNVEKNPKVPVLVLDGKGDSCFSTDYFLNILKVLEHVSDHFRIKEGVDTPAIIETEDFRFLLAPRIESE